LDAAAAQLVRTHIGRAAGRVGPVTIELVEVVRLARLAPAATLRNALRQLGVQLVEVDEARALLVKVAKDEGYLSGRQTERHHRVSELLEADPSGLVAHCRQHAGAALLGDQLGESLAEQLANVNATTAALIGPARGGGGANRR